MFSWITGPRIANAIEDLQPENNYESTIIEQPETPAHQFAVKAFKHAIFGTPAPEDTNGASKPSERKKRLDAANAKKIDLPAPPETTPPVSPSKQPGGILMTPGTTSKGRKTVSFGSQVMDNEGKKVNGGKSGIPNDCPGKFPSPWTPGAQLKLDPSSDKRPRNKLTEALLDARTTTQPTSGQKPRARDDTDITIDMGAPRSESGKYWKEQYESYAERSEKEMKKVIAKQQLAKKFAMKKDGEVTELVTKLEQERKRFRQRERELEQQNKNYQEQAQRAIADSASASIEIAELKARVAILERSAAMSSSEIQNRPSFDIYEDSSKTQPQRPQARELDASLAPSVSMASSSKENTSPTSTSQRRRPLLDAPILPKPLARFGTDDGQVSLMLGKSPRASSRSTDTSEQTRPAPAEIPKSPLDSRKWDSIKENGPPSSPFVVLPSSPLPMPSSDPWLAAEASSILQMDKMALPVSTGVPYSRPEWNPPPKKPRHAKQTNTGSAGRKTGYTTAARKSVSTSTKALDTNDIAHGMGSKSTTTSRSLGNAVEEETKTTTVSKAATTRSQSASDPKFGLSTLTAHHAEGSRQVKQDRAEILPTDRKAEARRRLEARKKLRKNAAA
ncbi:hypothetical protein IAQ61_011980 [Plenodomus lingam]|uniref:Spindle pole body-associated protein cut12 domain-containing protein n=1 Tax=Leptosphaeria maculans (strain JN3 / isolate v23.1.3 / race Av1-4-5-6-7-8) TaxID=985895 RepID=E5ABQ0_LEPMJ|nr:hypothetical protein LEMA_P022210.1 [Plenodomus lingam JN3]KAH9860196.1 hypothetical protein IAQ61_011980 [Plenodomus lingam]CBY01091.1 hypothetical protein LEMA_P022210.1 [Plenodomus lingam JN3]